MLGSFGGRMFAFAALIVAVGAVAIALLGGGGTDYRISARFQNASQLVNGNLVQVAGRAVGVVTDIDLTPDGQADVRIKITDADYAPLRRGTQATVRQASLSGVANRYVDLRLPPGDKQDTIDEGGSIEQADTTTAVDLDQLFNTFDPKSRKALQGFIRGSAAQYKGQGEKANRGLVYLNPTLASSSRLFEELDRDTPLLRRFIDASSGLVTDVAARRSDLAGLVSNLADTTGAIAAERDGLDSALQTLPKFMRRANTTFVNLRATLDDLEPLIDESKPVAKKLRPFLAELRPLARDARPTLRDLSKLTQRVGSQNDLVDLANLSVKARDVAVSSQTINGKQREGAFPASVKALNEATPELGFARPYAVDLTGWFDDFSHSGIIDALGGASRVAPHVNAFANVNGVLKPIVDPALQTGVLEGVASINQRNRCPGSVERGGAYKPTPDYNCDLSQVPLGP